MPHIPTPEYAQSAWGEACDAADREGRWFVMYDHPLMPGKLLSVNDPEAPGEHERGMHEGTRVVVRPSQAVTSGPQKDYPYDFFNP